MTWFSGKPHQVLCLRLSAGDPVVANYRHSWRNVSSVLDDQVLRAFSFKNDDGQDETAVYLAKLYQPEQAQDGAIFFVKVATLPHLVHRVALLDARKGFVSLEYSRQERVIKLRVHSWDGTITVNKSAPAAAAYGDLVIDDQRIAICISSGRKYAEDSYLLRQPDVPDRVDYDGNGMINFGDELDIGGDQILIWDYGTGIVSTVWIPQDDKADDGHPMHHRAQFQFVGKKHIALAGTLPSSFGRPSALLRAFAIDDPEGSCRTFSHGENFEMDDDIGVVAKPGSSEPNDFIVNYHHQGSRLTVADPGLFTGGIHSEAKSNDPEGLHVFWSHPTVTRTIEVIINEVLPSLCNNRLLASHRVEPEDEGYAKFALQAPHESYGYIFWIYDFDQVRCRALINAGSSQRAKAELQTQLAQENPQAQVRVVSRNFRAGIEEEEDREYVDEQVPKDWDSHMLGLYQIDEARKRGEAETPVLELDEGPAERKDKPRLLFTKSVLCFPHAETGQAINPHALALTCSAIVALPGDDTDGYVFYFKDQ